MSRIRGRCVGWIGALVVVTGLTQLTPVFGADMSSHPSAGKSARSRTMEQHESRRLLERSLDAMAFDSLLMGNADANIPPEALRGLAAPQGVPLAEFAQAPSREQDALEFEAEMAEYDPWESFNRRMFAFNQRVDRYILKPVARVWNFVVPDLAQQSVANVFDNIAMPRRFINHLLQVNPEGAGRELVRFFLNISMGVGGLFDVATELGIPRREADTGQTLGIYGVGPGPFLVLPFLPPLTVRDGFGYAADTAMQPLGYFAPFEASAAMRGVNLLNDRSLNLETFEELEQITFDLYSAVRNAYLQRRQRMIQE